MSTVGPLPLLRRLRVEGLRLAAEVLQKAGTQGVASSCPSLLVSRLPQGLVPSLSPSQHSLCQFVTVTLGISPLQVGLHGPWPQYPHMARHRWVLRSTLQSTATCQARGPAVLITSLIDEMPHQRAIRRAGDRSTQISNSCSQDVLRPMCSCPCHPNLAPTAPGGVGAAGPWLSAD